MYKWLALSVRDRNWSKKYKVHTYISDLVAVKMGFDRLNVNTTAFNLHVCVFRRNIIVHVKLCKFLPSFISFTYSIILVLGSNGASELSPNLSITWSQEQSHAQIIQLLLWLLRVIGWWALHSWRVWFGIHSCFISSSYDQIFFFAKV